MTHTIPTNNFFTYLSQLAEQHPTKEAILRYSTEGEKQEVLSFRDLKERIIAVGAWLYRNGIQKGDTVAFAMTNSPELLILSWSAWCMGVITVPLDVKRDTMEHHQYKLSLTKAKCIITHKDMFTKAEKDVLTSSTPVHEVSEKMFLTPSSFSQWETGITHTALILFTSGTTAHPKGVVLTLENLLVNADGIKQWLHLIARDRFLVVLPMHHINSTTFCLTTLLAGASIAIIPTYSNSKFWRQVAATKATFTSIVQSICFDQLSRVKEFAAVQENIQLGKIQIGSAPVVVKDAMEFVNLFKIPLYQGYGQTETALRVTGVPIDLSSELYRRLLEQNSIGMPMKWATVGIMDEKGKILSEGEEGELVVKGPAIMQGYLGGEEAFKDGYFLTGDIGYYKMIDGKKFYFLKGRKKEIIIKGGINISPVAVENQLKQLNTNIDQVYVVGIPDDRYGEEIGAVVIWKHEVNSGDAMIQLKAQLLFAAREHISAYETPRYLTSILVSDLPMTSTGKIQRAILRMQLPLAVFAQTTELLQVASRHFTLITPDSPLLPEALSVYNNSWQPLTLDMKEFRAFVSHFPTIAAIDTEKKILGMVSFVKTALTDDKLSMLTYADILHGKADEDQTASSENMSLVCISICSATYKHHSFTKVQSVPSPQQVEAYLFEGKDGVYNFHITPKGGFAKGASLVRLLPNARPEDKSAVGYNMLMKYPEIRQSVRISPTAPVSQQLIEVVMKLAEYLEIPYVSAFSRPGGLARYLARANA